MVRQEAAIPIAVLIITGVVVALGIYFGASIPEVLDECTFPSYICDLGKLIGFPSGFLRPERFIYYALIPISAMAIIIFGFLDAIKIFRRTSINIALGILIAFSTIPLGFYVILVATLFAFMGTYATFAFVVLFIVGVAFYARALFRGWRGGILEREMGIYDLELGRLTDEMNEVKKQRDDLEREAERWKSMFKAGKADWDRTQKELAALTKKMTDLKAKYDGLKAKYDEVSKQKVAARKTAKKTKPD